MLLELLTPEIEDQLVQSYLRHNPPYHPKDYRVPYRDNERVIVRYFYAESWASWWVLDGAPILNKRKVRDNGILKSDYMFYGLIDYGYGERHFGTFLLSALLRLEGKMSPLGVLRDDDCQFTYKNLRRMPETYTCDEITGKPSYY